VIERAYTNESMEQVPSARPATRPLRRLSGSTIAGGGAAAADLGNYSNRPERRRHITRSWSWREP
jgi:hypothetical protein